MKKSGNESILERILGTNLPFFRRRKEVRRILGLAPTEYKKRYPLLTRDQVFYKNDVFSFFVSDGQFPSSITLLCEFKGRTYLPLNEDENFFVLCDTMGLISNSDKSILLSVRQEGIYSNNIMPIEIIDRKSLEELEISLPEYIFSITEHSNYRGLWWQKWGGVLYEVHIDYANRTRNVSFIDANVGRNAIKKWGR